MSTNNDSHSHKSGTATLVIENFSKLVNYRTVGFSLSGFNIYFGLYSKIDIKDFANDNVYVYWYSDSHFCANLHFKISIANARNEKLFTMDYNWKFDGVNKRPVVAFMSRTNLEDSKNGYLENDKLTLLCEYEEIDQKQDNTVFQDSSSIMSQDYESLLQSGDYSDATLVIGKREFRVHKTILAARSSVFGAMFKHEQTKEARENRVDIIDVEADVFEQLIRYIYTGKVESMDRFALELLIAADKYQVNSLKTICEVYLSFKLATESVANVLLVADLHQSAELRSKCIEYIGKNVRQVKASEGWKSLEARTELLVELLIHLSDKNK